MQALHNCDGHLTLWRPLLSREYSYKASSCSSHWALECPDVKNYKWRLHPVWHTPSYSRCIKCSINLKFLRHSDFQHRQTDRQTDGMRHKSSARYKCTLAARRQTSNNDHSMLMLRAVWRQRRATYFILTIMVRITVDAMRKIPCSRNNRCIAIKPSSTKSHKRRVADNVRFEWPFKKTSIKNLGALWRKNFGDIPNF